MTLELHTFGLKLVGNYH